MIDFKSNEIFSYLIFIYGIMGIPAFHIFYKPKLIILKKPYSLMLKFLILVAVIFTLLYINKTISLDIYLLAVSPLYQVFLYRCSFIMFLKKMKRIPKDVAMNFKSGLFIDRVYAWVYTMLAVIVPVFSILFLRK